MIVARPPKTKEELWWYVKAMWGFEIPRHSVCEDHSAPFDAFAEAFFAEAPISLWKASRGFGGKSTLMGVLSLTEAVALGAQVTVLGGSASQSQRVHEVTHEMWYSDRAPKQLLKDDPTQFKTKLKGGAWITALMASQKSVRGPHPQRLRLDEVDEMEMEIFEAAQGQPMDARGLLAQTVISSTHQYPNGTMTQLLKRANQKGWPVHHWCWRESVGTEEHPGWLSMEAIKRKKQEVSETMWNTEYDLQEPSHAGRAINTEAVEAMFDPELGVYEGDLDERLIFELPVPEGTYVTGVDWAKELDWTIMSTWRTDVNPWRRVAFLRTGRKPWPQMVGDLQTRLDMFGGLLVHDATGLGDVLDDLIVYDRNKTTDFVLRGRQREAAFNEFVSGVEQRAMTGPRIKFAFEELKYATANDLYGSGHPPDSFIADALAWSRRNAYIPLVSPAAILKS